MTFMERSFLKSTSFFIFSLSLSLSLCLSPSPPLTHTRPPPLTLILASHIIYERVRNPCSKANAHHSGSIQTVCLFFSCATLSDTQELRNRKQHHWCPCEEGTPVPLCFTCRFSHPRGGHHRRGGQQEFLYMPHFPTFLPRTLTARVPG